MREPDVGQKKLRDNMQVWDINKGEINHHLFGNKGPISSVAFSKDGKLGLSTSFLNSTDMQTVILWDLEEGVMVRKIEFQQKNEEKLDKVSFSPDDKLMFSLSKNIRVWDVKTGKLIDSFDNPGMNGYPLAFTRDQQIYVSLEYPEDDNLLPYEPLTIWEMQSGKILQVLKINKNHKGINAAFSADGKKIAVGGMWSNFLQIWDLESGQMTRDLKLPKEITSRFRKDS